MNPTENNAPPALVAQINKQKLFLILLAAVIAYVVLNFFLDRVQLIIMGLMVLIAGGYAVKEILTNKTRVVIDRSGVFDSRLGVGTIHWTDITRVYVREFKNTYLVSLDVADPDKYLNRRSTAARAALKFHDAVNKISPFSINTTVLDAGTDRIFEAIVTGHRYYNDPARTSPKTFETV